MLFSNFYGDYLRGNSWSLIRISAPTNHQENARVLEISVGNHRDSPSINFILIQLLGDLKITKNIKTRTLARVRRHTQKSAWNVQMCSSFQLWAEQIHAKINILTFFRWLSLPLPANPFRKGGQFFVFQRYRYYHWAVVCKT